MFVGVMKHKSFAECTIIEEVERRGQFVGGENVGS